MNKRLRELAKKSGFDWALTRDSLYGYSEDRECLEKFAEAIIKDCAKQVESVYKQGGGTYAEVILKHYNIKIK